MDGRNCEVCGKPIERVHPNRAGRFCSRECYYTVGPPARKTQVKYRMRTVRDHPLAPASGVVAVARLVLYEKIGAGPHACHWCGSPVDWMPGRGLVDGALIVDHLDWDTSNDAPENLVPTCNPCNAHRTRAGDHRRIRNDELTMMYWGQKRRAIERICQVCGVSFLARPGLVDRGGGKCCSRACAGRIGADSRWGRQSHT